ncbi:MAG: bifunctional methylenetetrahydrofolate dehydrogenase/methenyltetrahydrofolate cyclohydrolase FolD [Geminicoccaceae bacterium]|nr:bifunctional methylenetetrahydrofolate dehydrogenase/methenyltetrahydrofolate cyclohydrolase FolD [Geminicoccaceae bacterium]
MSARLIDGKAAAADLRARLADEASSFERRHGRRPGLRVVIVGDHPASRAYVRTKERMAGEVGIDGALVELPGDTGEAALLEEIDRLNRADEVDGILVQLPLPDGVDASRVIEAIDPAKDVDGFHPINVGRLFSASGRVDQDLLVPCTPLGCLMLLEQTLGGDLRGRQAVVVGRSNIVGKPMAALLLGADCTVTVAHSKTRDLPGTCRQADILIAAVGRPRMIRGDWIREGAAVVDVGINRVEGEGGKGRLVGDVDFESAREIAGAITPVPGGVGPMTVGCLLRNTLVAARARAGA